MDDKKGSKITFGRKLKELTARGKKKEKTIAVNLESIAPILEKLIAHVSSCALQQEGILRISGTITEANALKEGLLRGEEMDLSKFNVNDIASVMKSLLREMPEPLLTFDAYEPLLKAATENLEAMLKDSSTAIKAIRGMIDNFEDLFPELQSITPAVNRSSKKEQNEDFPSDYYEEILNREKDASERLVKELSEKAVLETIKSQLELQIATLKSRNEELESGETFLQQKLEEMSRDMEMLRNERREKQQEIDKLSNELHSERSDGMKMKDELIDKKKLLEESRKGESDAKLKLQQNLENESLEVNKLKILLQAETEKRKALERENEALKRDSSSKKRLEEDMKTLTDSKKKLEQEIADMKKAPLKSSESGKNTSLPKEIDIKKNFGIKPTEAAELKRSPSERRFNFNQQNSHSEGNKDKENVIALQREIEQLKRDLEVKTNELYEAKRKPGDNKVVQNIQQELEQLKTKSALELRGSVDKSTKLELEVKNSQEAVRKMDSQVRLLTEQKQQLEKDLQLSKEHRIILEKELQEARNSLEKSENNSKTISEQKTEIERLKKQINDKEAQISSIRRRSEEVRKSNLEPPIPDRRISQYGTDIAEDVLLTLFNWMILAIRLDSLSRGVVHNNFDKQVLFLQLQKDRIPFSTWPKYITREFEKHKQ